jgi:hypothetical protein
MSRATVAALFVLTVYASTARAQDEPRVGLVMGYPPAFGALWRLSDRVAVRPEITFTETATSTISNVLIFQGIPQTTITTASTGDNWAVGVGASALIYVSRWESLRTYVSPRYAYSHTSSSNTSTSSSPLVSSPTTEFTSISHSISGSFGAEYSLARRFSVFGEVGVVFAHNESANPTFTTSNSSSSGHSVAVRSAAGVMLFF